MNDRLKLQNLKIMAEQLGNLLPVIRNQVQETIKDPKALGEMLSEKNPWLGKQVLNIASYSEVPFILGTGIELHESTEDKLEFLLPHRWKNLGVGGGLHVGALISLCEEVGRQIWMRSPSLDVLVALRDLQIKLLKAAESDVIARAVLNPEDVEAMYFKARQGDIVRHELLVQVYDKKEQLVCEALLSYEISCPEKLGQVSL